MPKLNQIIAIEGDTKKHAADTTATAISIFNKPSLLNGQTRTYQPKDAAGDTLPDETTNVQYRLDTVMEKVRSDLGALFDVTATKDFANTKAKATVSINGTTLVEDAPIPYLLFLEKQLAELERFVRSLPTLNPGESWTHDDQAGLWKTEPVQTNRSQKVPRVLVKYEHTDKHPAQTEVWHEDVTVGFYTQIKMSGAWPLTKVEDILGRIHTLQEAVKTAREEANGVQVERKKTGEVLLKYLFE